MNILLIGSGGREHALALALNNSKSLSNLYCVPGNPGILKLAQKADIDISNHNQVVKFCKKNYIELVIIGPEQPLADGLADSLTSMDFCTFGPSRKAAMLESSKGFAKEFMKRHGIPTAEFRKFSISEKESAYDYLRNCDTYPLVLKADGLAAGKGVIIVNNKDEALEVIGSMFDGLFGKAGKTVIIEEFMTGEEASIFAICDGKNYVTLASSQDHKKAMDGDKGPNTGGMGAYSPAAIITDEILETVKQEIIVPTINGMNNEASPFIGCLYVGLMIDKGKAKVVEFNARFGDPETQAVLSGFKGDFAELLFSAAKGELNIDAIENIKANYSCCVILASAGYPGNYQKGFEITGINQAEENGTTVYHSGTTLKNEKLFSAGGRVLGVTGKGKTLKESIDKAYSSIKKIHFENSYFRNDIGMKGLKRK